MDSYLMDIDFLFSEMKKFWGQAHWHTPVIPALWEAEVSRLQAQEIETVLANMVKLPLYKVPKKISWMWWHAPVVPATWEAKAGESLEPGRWRLR